ncbi:GNAT family N-acetyltransferase [Stigmatella sp. ncwal1]|uniref:GNAT family N-acetyltransferase n=1 Tax=Stigmatella ashevillensis TaxID=2995309 RepID=A0ABT5DIQ7_9BACT|nr:GNAT family N-acetyltransferase [Stigmatella ashevillena]MDC0713513.1 GNAT family N-acetyltransferase [Stigmatella ashevillena]
MDFRIERASADDEAELVPALAEVLMDCVEGGASVSFMAGLTPERAEAFWRKVFGAVRNGTSVLLVARDDSGVQGTVQIDLDLPDNQRHRADLKKLLVRRTGRRRGIAQALVREIEREALLRHRTLLVLDTVTGSAAEQLYAQLGWTRVGVIPDYALMPDGQLCATTLFYKKLS